MQSLGYASFVAVKRNGGNTVNITDYTQGLDGVNQLQNYFFINTAVTFFVILAGLCLFLRLYNLSNNYYRQMIACTSTNDRQTFFARNQTTTWPWIKKHILYAPLWTKRHNKELQLSSAVSVGTLPSRFHFALIIIYVLSNIIFCTVLDYRTGMRAATLAELRGRSGALATGNLIPTILFALRNNPFIPLLQVTYDTFNLFHRWLARIVIAESTVHVFAWAANAVAAGGKAELYTLLLGSTSFKWGAVAAVGMFVIFIQAWSPIRHAFYETFLTGHRILVMVTLIGIYIHLDKAKLPQVPYVTLTFVIWGLEVAIRTGRIIYYNYAFRRQTTVMVEAFDTDACRVTFDLARPWKPRPGTHVHVYLPTVGLWSSHPFSVAWSERIEMQELQRVITGKTELPTSSSTRTTLSLIMRARSGMTRKLHTRASKSANGVIALRAYVEGPYGGHESLDSYGTVLLFAGGVGITHQLSYAKHLLAGAVAGTVAARKIVLVWSMPQKECMEWVRPWLDEILAMPRRSEFLQIITYVTRDKGDRLVSASGSVQMVPGRCVVQEVVDGQFEERIGAMVVTVCGPGAFADDVRAAVRGKVDCGSVDFIEEAFTY